MATTPVSIRLGPADERRLKLLMASTGIQSRSDLVRHALAELARARGLETAAEQQQREAS